jgi:hypothetical protein
MFTALAAKRDNLKAVEMDWNAKPSKEYTQLL